MVYRHRKESDDLLEILGAYRFPTILMSAGLVMAIVGFLLALQYNMAQSERSFREISDRAYSSLNTEVTQHERLVSSMAYILGQIENLTEPEFIGISNSLAETSFFTGFYLYRFHQGSAPEEKGYITRFFSSAGPKERVENINDLSEIRRAIEKAKALDKVYFSGPYKPQGGSSADSLAVIAMPFSGKSNKDLFVVGILALDELFRSFLRTESGYMNARVYNRANSETEMIYEQINPEDQEFFTSAGAQYYKNLSFQRTRFFDDHSWEVRIFSSRHDLMRSIGLFPWTVFIAIITVTGLLSYIVFRITTENLKAEALVEEQTKNLRSYAEKLEMSNRDLDDFAHIASHDLREPLRGIYNYAEFLKEDYNDKLDDEGRQKLDTLKHLARRMESLIESLLEYSRLSRIDLAFKRTNLNQVLEDVLDTLKIWLEEKKVTVSVKGPLPELVCDSVKIAEVFRNLITNAVKYNDKPDKKIEVGYIPDHQDWGKIPVFYVKDNGIGIAQENRGKIFKIFKRLHAREEYGGGTGVGLTIIWKIIERHGGKVWVESELNEGTTFFFTLRRKSDG